MTHTNNRFCYACAASAKNCITYALRDHGDIIDEESVNRYLSANVPQCLLCIAENMGNDISKNHLAARNFQKTFDYVVNNDFMKDSIVYLDSAGYQIQRGRILNKHLFDYAKDYHHFIQENAGRIGRAFTLDFSPSTDISVFSSLQEVYGLNLAAYQMAAALPEDLRDKMLAIMHFRGPNLYSTFRNLLFTDGFAHAFKRFAVGGLAVSDDIVRALPCYPCWPTS